MTQKKRIQDGIAALEKILRDNVEYAPTIIDLIDSKIALLALELNELQLYTSTLNKKINQFHATDKSTDHDLKLSTLEQAISNLRNELHSKETLSLTKRKVAQVLKELYKNG